MAEHTESLCNDNKLLIDLKLYLMCWSQIKWTQQLKWRFSCFQDRK